MLQALVGGVKADHLDALSVAQLHVVHRYLAMADSGERAVDAFVSVLDEHDFSLD